MGNCNLFYRQNNQIKTDEIVIRDDKVYSRRKSNYENNTAATVEKNISSHEIIACSRTTNTKKEEPKFKESFITIGSSGAEENAMMTKSFVSGISGRIINGKTKTNYLDSIISIQRAFRLYLRNRSPLLAPIDGVRRNFPFFVEFPSGVRYMGEWKNGKKDGVGMLKWSDGDIYFGMISNNKMHGYGKYYNNSTGSHFEGCFVNDLISGYGIETWSDGSYYEGEYLNNLKEGLGILTFDDGSYYIGQFKCNDINGFGSFYKKDNSIHQGYYIDNKLNGLGIIISPDGKTFQGQFDNDKKEGFGILYDKNKPKNTIYIGIWIDNKLENEAVAIENKEMKTYFFKNSKKIKELKHYESQFDKIAEEVLGDSF